MAAQRSVTLCAYPCQELSATSRRVEERKEVTRTRLCCCAVIKQLLMATAARFCQALLRSLLQWCLTGYALHLLQRSDFES